MLDFEDIPTDIGYEEVEAIRLVYKSRPYGAVGAINTITALALPPIQTTLDSE